MKFPDPSTQVKALAKQGLAKAARARISAGATAVGNNVKYGATGIGSTKRAI